MKLYLKVSIEASGDTFSIYVDTKVASLVAPVFNHKKDSYTPTKGDKFYFLPGVNIPRIKLKDMALKHGVRNVRNIEDATHIFGGSSSYAKMINRKYEDIAKTKDFLDFVDLIKDYTDEYYLEKVAQAFEFYDLEEVILTRSISYTMRYNLDNSHPLYDDIRDTNLYNNTYNSYIYSVDSDYEDVFKNLVTKEIWDEDSLLVHVNGEDAVTIDADMYEQMADMFKSSDSDNHILAMEIMANSNYKDSLLYLEILFMEFNQQMYNSHTKKHVNFKSLLSYLGKENGMDTKIDDIMRSLTNKGVLTIDMINVLMTRYHDKIEKYGNSIYFKVKTITVNEDTLALLNTNYTYSVLDNYQPEPVDITEEEVEEFPEIHGNLDDLRETTDVCNESAQEELITDEDIETAFTRIERNELKSELIELEESEPVSEFELNKGSIEEEKEFPEDESVFTEEEDYALGEMISKLAEEESNNNQKEENGTDDFEWF